MNPHERKAISPLALARSLWENRHLIAQMTVRDVVGRYRGSIVGILWSFITPIIMLAVYTFVFSVVFNARWGVTTEESKTTFAIVLFVGMIVHGMFAEVLNRAPNLILSNVNYVKKVIFPLEILPAIALNTAIFHTIISLIVLLTTIIIINGAIYWTALLTPIVFLPLAILSLGMAWILASLGVYVRDIGQTISIITTIMLFLAPVFYPISVLPEEYHPIILANPLTFIIEQARNVLIWGKLPDWTGLLIYTSISSLIAWAGYSWFQRTRKGFSDVL